MDDLGDLGDKELIQSALRGDFELIVGYGEEHPGAWAGAWFDNEPAVRIVAAFTGDVAQHEAALRPRLRHPDRLVVEGRQHSLSDLRQVREEIERTLEQRAAQTGRWILTSIGEGKGVIRVTLRADQENLASELAARYGSAVELRVGGFSFPDRRLVLRNSSSERIGPLGSGQPLVGSLLNASLETVGGYSGWIAGTGLILDLASGRSASIPVIYGTASTPEDLGYAVPPGSYWLKVQMPFRQGLGGPPTNAVTAPLTQITIVPRVRPRRSASP